MSSDWSSVKIGELCSIKRGASPRPIHDWMTSGEGIPWVKISDANSGKGKLVNETATRIKSDGRRHSVEVFPGDLILSNSATPGIPRFMGIYACIHDGWLLLRDFRSVDKDFLYYVLEVERPYLLAKGNGSVFTNLKTDILRDHEVSIPCVNEQKAIANILGTLDEKIELNQKTNETLEGIAKALFKSWFVDFDPVRAKADGRPTGLPDEMSELFPDSFEESELGEIPTGWTLVPIDKIANYLNGLALQKFPPTGDQTDLPVIKIAQLRKGNTIDSDKCSNELANEYVIKDGDILFSWSGSLLVDIWVGGIGALNQHLFKVTSNDFEKWFFYWWTKRHLEEFQAIAKSKATTMGHIQRKHLSEAMVLVPPQEVLMWMNEIFSPILSQQIHGRLQSRTLTSIRDALLPRLISGELRVPDAEKMLEEVGV